MKYDGAYYERKAEEFLRLKGYRGCAKNFRTRLGEIDLIVRDGDTTSFVEVKARNAHAGYLPQEAVTKDKRARIVRAARGYMQRYGVRSYRFDVVAIIEGELWRSYSLFKNAFTLNEIL
ncbi:MAG: YraN family protein [Candidatus Omnitrophica bacterium]|nr:YraN family protein [Candidatus Omnitrophota bacterium]